MVSQILSVAFEFAEYSLQHQLPNFAEVTSPLVTARDSNIELILRGAVLVGPRGHLFASV